MRGDLAPTHLCLGGTSGGGGPPIGTLAELTNIGASISRIGFWGTVYFIIIITRNPQNSRGNYLGPHINARDEDRDDKERGGA